MGRDTSFFTLIKEKVPLDDYLTNHLGVELVPSGPGGFSALCPFHEEDTPSFKVMESDDGWLRWWCFGACQEGGTVIDAAIRAENFALPQEACEYLNELYNLGLETNSEAFQAFRRTIAETQQTIERAQEEMADESSRAGRVARDYLHRRGFTDETIEHFGLAVDTSRSQAGRLAIPLIDKANHPVSVANRALFDAHPCASCKEIVTAKEVVKRRFQSRKAREKGEPPIDWEACPHCGASKKEAKIYFLAGQDPKYLYLRDFDKAEFLYHEYATRRSLMKEDVVGLYLVEGYADVWAGWQSGHHAIGAYNGAVLSEWQAREAVDLATRADKPIILVPDFDTTGLHNVDPNIRKLRSARDDIEVQVVWGVSALTYIEGGEEKRCKDLGDVLKHFGAERVAELMEENRQPAAEWQIRTLIDTKRPNGKPFYSMEQQMQLVAGVLKDVQTKGALDHLVPYLSERWSKPEDVIRTWFYSNLSEDNVTSFSHLIKDVKQARAEAVDFIRDGNVIPLGFEEIDRCFPGGGARKGQLMMILGKAQPLSAKVWTPEGWRRMGNLAIGDEVVDPDGGVARIRAIHPQGQRPIYLVMFDDGAYTECDLNHLWRVRRDGGPWQVKPLAELVDDLASWEIPVVSGLPHQPQQRFFSSIEQVGEFEAQCIELDSQSQLYITDDFIVTHNSGTGKTMLVSQLLANMADANVRAVFFSLEQAAKSLYGRLVSQALDVPQLVAEELISDDADELDACDQVFAHTLIVDNVPKEGQADIFGMTAERIRAITQEANMTRFNDRPADVVAVDHLGILEVSEDAPSEVKRSETLAPGWIMQELFRVCKELDVFLMVLQQLPKEIPPGEPFSYDSGRGGSKQTDYCDYICMIWRPEQKANLDDTERLEVAGQYKLALGKNRYGASAIAHLFFDKSSLRIMPALQVPQPAADRDQEIDGEVDIERAEGDETLAIEGSTLTIQVDESPGARSSDAGATKEGMEALERAQPDQIPQDTAELLAEIGGIAADDEEEVDQQGDPDLLDWFES